MFGRNDQIFCYECRAHIEYPSHTVWVLSEMVEKMVNGTGVATGNFEMTRWDYCARCAPDFRFAVVTYNQSPMFINASDRVLVDSLSKGMRSNVVAGAVGKAVVEALDAAAAERGEVVKEQAEQPAVLEDTPDDEFPRASVGMPAGRHNPIS